MAKDARSHVRSSASRVTSKSVAAKAAKVLASDDATADERSVAASALSQAVRGDGVFFPGSTVDVAVKPDAELDKIEGDLESAHRQAAAQVGYVPADDVLESSLRLVREGKATIVPNELWQEVRDDAIRYSNENDSLREQLVARDTTIADLTTKLADANRRADEQAEWARRQKT